MEDADNVPLSVLAVLSLGHSDRHVGIVELYILELSGIIKVPVPLQLIKCLTARTTSGIGGQANCYRRANLA